MRVIYREELDAFSRDLVIMCDLVREIMARASQGLNNSSLSQTEEALSIAGGLDELKLRCERRAIDLLALETPLASDLRQVVSSIYIVNDFDRMGALAMHVAKIARLRHPDAVLAGDTAPLIAKLSELAQAMGDKVQELLDDPDPDIALSLASEDDALDRIRDEIVAKVTLQPWPHSARHAADTALLARYYERYGDHCVNVAGRIIYLSTGLDPETYLAERDGLGAPEEDYWPERG